MDVREKLALSVCNATQKTSFKCEFNCEKKGKCAYCLVMADQMIANGVTVQEWIPVDDRPPEEKANCIVYYKHSYCDNDGYWAIGMCFYDGEKFQINPAYKVTHWMPLPPAPEDMK